MVPAALHKSCWEEAGRDSVDLGPATLTVWQSILMHGWIPGLRETDCHELLPVSHLSVPKCSAALDGVVSLKKRERKRERKQHTWR